MKQKDSNNKGMRDFLVLWIGQSISTLGSSMTSFALILWVYEQQGTATSITLLSFFTYLPSILFCFLAGTLADRMDKKKIMLFADGFAAMGTVMVFVLYGFEALQIWHLYLVNFAISFMNAFQNPASYVAVSLLAPKDQYHRVGGMYAFSNSLVTVFTPALATALLSFGGLQVVLSVDLATFLLAFLSLLLFIHIPKVADTKGKEKFWKSLRAGLMFLSKNKSVLNIILFFALINFYAYLTGFGILPALILSRTGGNETVVGMVSSAIGVGTLLGSIAVTLLKAPKSRTRVIFLSCAASFLLCNIPWAVSLSPVVWVVAALAGNFPLPFLNANLTTIMRTKVPLEMQGRVFSARDTIQYFTIPLGLLLGGVLADHVFEPLMAGSSSLAGVLSFFVGTGKGAGIAVMFFITGVLGTLSCLLAARSKGFRSLDD